MSLPPFTTVIHGKPPVKQGVFLNICIEYEPCHSMAPSGTPTIGPTPMPSTTDDCDPLAPPCKHDFLNICYEYWPCADEGNHDSYPTGIVDIFEHNHFNHTHPHGKEPPEGGEEEKEDSNEAPEESDGNNSDNTHGTTGDDGAEDASNEKSDENKKQGDDAQTPIEDVPENK